MGEIVNACQISDSSLFRLGSEKGKFYSQHIYLFVALYWDTCNIANYLSTQKIQEDTTHIINHGEVQWVNSCRISDKYELCDGLILEKFHADSASIFYYRPEKK